MKYPPLGTYDALGEELDRILTANRDPHALRKAAVDLRYLRLRALISRVAHGYLTGNPDYTLEYLTSELTRVLTNLELVEYIKYVHKIKDSMLES